MDGTYCRGTNQRGELCRARPIKGGRFCLKHDPDLAGQRAEWNRAGGKGKSNAARAAKRVPSDLRTVLDELYETLADLRAGTLPKGRATEIASVCRAIVAVYEVGAVEAELAELEASVRERSA